MNIAIMQPTYLPWIGYFELMVQSRAFVFFDDVQFAKKSWQHRNRIKGSSGEIMLSVPVLTSGHRFQQIKDAELDSRQPWATKHLRSIEINYAKAPFAEQYLPALRQIYLQPWKKLSELNVALIDFLRQSFGIETRLCLASSFPCRAERNEHIIDLCRAVGGDVLYDASGAAEVIDAGMMEKAGIRVVFQQYQHPVYRQQHGPFLSHLSAIDLLLNEGPRSLEIMRSGATPIA
jgi:hypothetical protein